MQITQMTKRFDNSRRYVTQVMVLIAYSNKMLDSF